VRLSILLVYQYFLIIRTYSRSTTKPLEAVHVVVFARQCLHVCSRKKIKLYENFCKIQSNFGSICDGVLSPENVRREKLNLYIQNARFKDSEIVGFLVNCFLAWNI